MLPWLVTTTLLTAQWYGTPPTSVERVVSLAPSLTETLFAIGAGDRVVAVSRFDDTPPEVHDLPKLGGVDDLNIEAVVALSPDLVVSVQSAALRPTYRRLAAMGIPVVTFDGERISSYKNTVQMLGQITGKEAGARALLRTLEQSLSAERGTPLAGERVLLLVARTPLFAATAASFHGDIIDSLGGTNVLPGPEGYVQLGLESLVALRPSLVIDLSGSEGDTSIPVPLSARWLSFPAAGLKRLGPRLARGVDALVRELMRNEQK